MSSTPASSPGWASDDYLGGARWPRRSLDPGSRQEDRLKGYWLILGAEVSDQEAQKEYGALWAPIAQRYEARLIAGSDAVKLIEARDAARVLLVEFRALRQRRPAMMTRTMNGLARLRCWPRSAASCCSGANLADLRL